MSNISKKVKNKIIEQKTFQCLFEFQLIFSYLERNVKFG